MVVDQLNSGYFSLRSVLPVQIPEESLNFDDFMVLHDIKSEKGYLRSMAEYLIFIAQQVVDELHTESKKKESICYVAICKRLVSARVNSIYLAQ